LLIEPNEVVENARIVFEQRATDRHTKVTSWLSDQRVIAKLGEYANAYVQRVVVRQMEAHEICHGTMRRETSLVIDLSDLANEVWGTHFKEKLRQAYSAEDLRLAYVMIFGGSGWSAFLSDDGRCIVAFSLWETCGATTTDMGRETRCVLEPRHEGLHDDGAVQWGDESRSTDEVESTPPSTPEATDRPAATPPEATP
jgi:hypothetical protein